MQSYALFFGYAREMGNNLKISETSKRKREIILFSESYFVTVTVVTVFWGK